jgi:glyoxylase-like metal-dependent hydrolase (beta-lactamase superfamily II)
VPHGSIPVGAVRIFALCDDEGPFPRPLSAAFPDVPPTAWAKIKDAYPATVEADGQGWRFHDHVYLVRTADRTVLVDAGIGPASSVASRWIGRAGRLPDELRAVGVAPEEVDAVVITHLHLDHFGWTLEGGRPVFPRARYLIQEADWTGILEDADEEDTEALESSIFPLADLGVLDLVHGEHALSRELTLLHTPGHTPGSQCVLVGSDGERALLTGDLSNHPLQLEEPGWRSAADQDPDVAAAQRRRWFERIEAEGLTFAPAHYPEPFGTIARPEGRRRWAPVTG